MILVREPSLVEVPKVANKRHGDSPAVKLSETRERMKELVKASVKMEVCHNNIIIEHRSFRWIELGGQEIDRSG